MEKSWDEILPVFGIEEDCILSRQGDFTLAFRVRKPEIFTLSAAQHEGLHQAFVKAIRLLPPGSILHMQDWFLSEKYAADFTGEEKSFLGNASESYFNERPWLDHESWLFVTKRPKGRKESSSAASSLLRRTLVPAETLDSQSMQEFKGQTGQFRQVLEDSGLIRLEPIGQNELWSTTRHAGLIERYCSLSRAHRPILRDPDFSDGFKLGEQYMQLYTLADAEHLPVVCGSRIGYDKYSTDKTDISIGFASVLGALLPVDHIYNQYIFIEDAPLVLKKLESKRLRLQSLAAYSRENSISEEAVNEYLNEALEDQRLPVRAHFNVLAWTDDKTGLGKIRNAVSGAMAKLEASPHLETCGAPQIWWAGLPGNEAEFPMNDTFQTFAEQACCFINTDTNYRSSVSPFGIRLGDRLTGRPVHVDLDQEPRSKGITQNSNMICLSGTGGGKSFFTNHLVRACYEQGGHVVIVDVGHSYEIQCALHKGYYFTYREDNPIRFNPFYLAPGDMLDIEKRESIKTLLLALWKKSDESHNRSEYVALSSALQLYFERLAADPTLRPGFNSFYEFLKKDFLALMREEGVKEKDFDIHNFLYVLRPFYHGGEFDYLLNAHENLDMLGQRFMVFEMDNIKDHPVLFPVVTLIIMELFVGKMRKLKGVRKMIVIEEAWKAIAKGGMQEYIKYLFKTARKFFASAAVVSQEIEDILSSDIIRHSIVNNSDIRVLLDQSKFKNKFEDLQILLGIDEKQKAEILSINKGHEPGRIYKDCWIGLGAAHSRVYRLEVSEEEYYTYTSDQKEKMLVWDYIRRYGDVRKAIRQLVADKQAQKNDRS